MNSYSSRYFTRCKSCKNNTATFAGRCLVCDEVKDAAVISEGELSHRQSRLSLIALSVMSLIFVAAFLIIVTHHID